MVARLPSFHSPHIVPTQSVACLTSSSQTDANCSQGMRGRRGLNHNAHHELEAADGAYTEGSRRRRQQERCIR